MTCTTTILFQLLLQFFITFPSGLLKQIQKVKTSNINARNYNAEQTIILHACFHTLARNERPSSIPPQLQRTTTSSDSIIEADKQNGFSIETRFCTCTSACTKPRRDLQTRNMALHGLCDPRYTHCHGGIGCYSSLSGTASKRFLGISSEKKQC